MKAVKSIHASGLHRVMNCSGSPFFDLPKPEANEAAEEGIAAGEYLEHLLLGSQLIPGKAKNGLFYDDDMKFYAKFIADEVLSGNPENLTTECNVDWDTDAEIMIKARYDISYMKNGVLYFDDYKYGWSLIDVKENWQLLAYAIGYILNTGVFSEKIVLRILQPRPHHEDGPIRSWEVTYDQLMSYREKIESRMHKIRSEKVELSTGTHCKYCPAAASACPAFNRAVFNGIDHTLNYFMQDDIDDRELSHQLDLLSRVSDIVKIKSDSLNQLATSRIAGGKIIPGYITESTYGNRSWKPGISPEVIEVMTGKKVTEQIMLSPAKAEKIGVPKDLIGNFVERKFLGQKLKKANHSEVANKIFGKQGE